ncbi:MAG: glycosyltransferase family 39 protein [candidate division FCPU426 bacterium]
MSRVSWGALSLGALFLIGQVVILAGNPPLGGAASLLAVALSLGWWLKRSGKPIAPWVAVAALGCAAWAQALVKAEPKDALWLFILSGLLLFLAKPAGLGWKEDGAVPSGRAPLEKWEPWFVLGLLGLAIVTRFVPINGFPFGSIAEEAQHVPVLEGAMASQVYVPHFTHGNMGTPTLMSYLGAAASRVFGRHINSYRMGVELFSVFSILAFYFTARRASSPFTAAVTSILYSVSLLHLTLSRRFYPYIVIFLPVVLGWGLWLEGLARRRWYWFFLAGLAAGFSLHGYEPGRGVFLIFLAWAAWMWLAHRPRRMVKGLTPGDSLQPASPGPALPSGRDFALFWVGFLIVAGPIFYHMSVHWDNYWHYVASKNPNRTQTLAAYVKQVWSLVGVYAHLFQVKSDGNYTMYTTYQPLLDPVTSALFGLSFFFVLARAWQPMPSFVLLFFFAGLAPALIGGGEEHPTARRTCLATPAIYLIIALGLERLRLLFRQGLPSWGRRILLAAAVFLTAGVAAYSLHYYFFVFGDSPEARTGYCWRGLKIAQALDAHPKAYSRLQPLLYHEQIWVLAKHPGQPGLVPTQEDLLVLAPDQDQQLFLEGYMEPTLPFWRSQFPNAQVTVYREKYPDRPFCETWPYFKLGTDPNNPATYLIQINIPRQDVAFFQMLVDATTGQHLPVWNPEFGAGLVPGQRLRLAGAVVTHPGAVYSWKLGWLGWQITVDKKPAEWSQDIPLDQGVHYFEISGPVPAGCEGPLPLVVLENGRNVQRLGSVVGLPARQGMLAEYRNSPSRWDGPAEVTSQKLFGQERFYSVPPGFGLPLSAIYRCRLQVPEDGEYSFETKHFSRCRLLLDGREAFNNFNNVQAPVITPMALAAGKPVALEAQFIVEGETLTMTFQLFYRRPGQKQAQWVPMEWLRLP